MASVFLTGASGYIGGQVLHELANAHPEFAIAVLVRNSEAAKKISEIFPKVRIVNGSLDDVDLVENEASQASIVLNLASNSHIPSTAAIHRGLTKKVAASGSAYWIQVSGASALAAAELASSTFTAGSASSKVWDDVADIAEYRSFIRSHPARALDNYLLDVAAESPSIKTAVVLPPIIYGPGQGPVNQRSVQIPDLAKVTLERGHAVRVGQGQSRWGNVHVRDVARIFVGLAEEAANGNKDENIWGENGIYLTGVGEITFAEISDRIAQAAVDQGHIASTEVEELQKPDSDTVLPYGTVLFGTNSRSKARRAIELLGWRPTEESLEAEIPRVVGEEASKRG